MPPAAEATILAFPYRPRADQDELELGRDQRVDAPPPDRAGGGLGRVALRAASGLLLLVAPLLLPGQIDANDAATLALAVMLATLVATIASVAPLLGARGYQVAAALALVTAMAGVAGRAGLVGIGLLALIEASRARLRGPSSLSALLLAAGTALRLDLGAALSGTTLPPALLAAGLLLGLFAGLLPAPGRRPLRQGDELWREVALLGLMAGAVSFYAAGLLADPATRARAGTLAVLSVPALLGCLLRLWWVTRLREAVHAARLERLTPVPVLSIRP